MSWIIQVENLSKQYRMGTAVTSAFDSFYQVLEHRIAKMARRVRGLPPPSIPVMHESGNVSNLVLSAEQQEGCPPGHFWALHNVSFEINEGDRIGIVGKNGSGKSTLLKILSRIAMPTSGHFRYRGSLVSLLEVGTGFHPDLSGRENIMLNAKINGMSSRAIKKIFNEIVDFSELGKQIDTPIKRYSSGMYMRLAFSVAAHLESDILIVDEVLAVGDSGFQKKCINKMLEVTGQGRRTLLFVSHDMNAISTLCNKALELSHGRVVDSTPTKQIIENSTDGLCSVNRAIANYVQNGTQKCERVWDDDKAAPKMLEGSVVMRRAAMVNAAGEVTDQFDISDDVYVLVEFDMQVPRSRLHVHIYLSTLTGQRLFVSMDNIDAGQEEGVRPQGRYKETCIINKNLLNEGTYVIEVVICTDLATDSKIVVSDALSFVLVDSKHPASVRGNWENEWPSYPIRPRLNWVIERA